ncbi:MAG: hypothetical protein RLZZ301_815 [Bacteroidota bacterium]|jgi:6,7-dimethyl-8-ribityllumazine synthase
MATANKNLSEFPLEKFQNCADFRIGIVVSDWNQHITDQLLAGALSVLEQVGITAVLVKRVPGAFELPLAAQYLCKTQQVDGIVAIGVVIQGETRHFDFVCAGTTNGIMDVMLTHNTPIGFCLLTDNTEQQSLDRAGGKHGNKGIEATVAVLQQLQLLKELAS